MKECKIINQGWSPLRFTIIISLFISLLNDKDIPNVYIYERSAALVHQVSEFYDVDNHSSEFNDLVNKS